MNLCGPLIALSANRIKCSLILLLIFVVNCHLLGKCTEPIYDDLFSIKYNRNRCIRSLAPSFNILNDGYIAATSDGICDTIEIFSEGIDYGENKKSVMGSGHDVFYGNGMNSPYFKPNEANLMVACPVVNITSTNSNICEGETVELSANISYFSTKLIPVSSNLCLNPASNNANNSTIHQNNCTTSTYQDWMFELVSGYTDRYLIKNIGSGHYLRPLYGGIISGTNLSQANGTNTSYHWRLDFYSEGIYHIQHVISGKYLDVSGGSLSSGADMIIWDFHGGINQQFYIENGSIPYPESSYTYTWSNGATTNPVLVTPSTTQTYSVSISNSANSCVISNNITINVTASPTINSVTSGSRCGAGSVVLSVNASASTINWYADSFGGNSLGTGQSFTTPSISGNTTYYVDVSDGVCTSQRSPVEAIINAFPIVNFISNGQRCNSGTVTLLASSSDGEINWYSSLSGGTSLGTGDTFTTPVISSTTTYYVESVSPEGCVSIARQAVIATIQMCSETAANAPCNEKLPWVNGPDFDNINVNVSDNVYSFIPLCLGGVSNVSRIVDGNLSNYATLSFTAALLGCDGEIRVKDGDAGDYYPAGFFAGFKISSANLLSGSVGAEVTVKTYRNNILQEEESLVNSSIGVESFLDGSGLATVGFITTQDFDEIRIEFKTIIGIIQSYQIYHPVIGKFCGGPAIECNTLTPMKSPTFPVIIEPENTGISGLVCVGCSIENTDEIINSDDSDYATVVLAASVGTTASVSVKDVLTSQPAGVYAGFNISNPSLISANLLSGLSLKFYNNGVLVQSSNSASLLSTGSSILNGIGYQIVGMVSTVPFNEVKLEITNLLGVVSTTRIYNLVVQKGCVGTLDCNTMTSFATPAFPAVVDNKLTGINGIACVLCSINNTQNLVNSNVDDYASIVLNASVGTSASIAVADQVTDHPAGTYVGFEVSSQNIVDANILANITISTYLNGVLQEVKSTNNQLLYVELGLFGTEGRRKVGFISSLPFDEARISFNELVNANPLGLIKVYGLVIEKFCPVTIECDESYYLSSPEFPVLIDAALTGKQGLVCVGCSLSNWEGAISASNSDYAQAIVTAGVLSSVRLAVMDVSTTYPAGSTAGFMIQDVNNFLQLDLFNGLRISTYNNGVLQESKTGIELIDFALLFSWFGTGPSKYNVGFKTTKVFDEISIEIGSLASVLNIVNIHSAFVDTHGAFHGALGCDSCIPIISGATPATRCGPGSVTLGATTNSGTIDWFSAPLGGTSLGSGDSFTTQSISGTTTYYAEASNGLCTSTRVPVLATIIPQIAITISNSGSICYQDSQQLTANAIGGLGGYEYEWTGPGSFTGNTATIDIPSNGTYALTVTDSYGCTDESQTIILQEYTPSVDILNTTVCEGEIVNLSISSPTAVSYLWSANTGSQTTATISVTPLPPSTLYKVTVTSTDLCTAVPEVTINVNTKPIVTVNGPVSLCISETSSLQANVGGSWVALNPSIATINSSGLVTGISAGFARFIFTSSATNCQSDTTSVIEIFDKPTISVIGPSTICILSTTQLTPTSGGTWVSSNPAVASVNNTGLVSGITAGTAHFTFTDSNTGCASDPSTTVTIESGNKATITGPVSLCMGSNAQLLASPIGGTWISLNPAIATVSSAGLITPVSDGVAQIQYNHNSGSCSIETMYTITVYDLPNVSYTSTNTSCTTNNGSITMSFTNHPTRTEIKLSINDGVTYTTVSDTLGSYTFNNLSTGTYRLHAKLSNDECDVTIGQVVLIDSIPAPQTIITHTNEPCGTLLNGSITFTITDDPLRSQLSISLDGGSTWPYTISDNIGTYTINDLAPSIYSVATKWIDESCTKIIGLVEIESGYANAGVITPTDTICYGQSKLITASGGSSYVWSHGPTTASINVSPQTSTSYSVTIYQTNGCSSVKNTLVMVVGQMSVNMNFDDGLCLTDTSEIIAIHNGGLAPYLYNWMGPSGSAGSSKTISITESGNYYLTVTDSKGCTASTSGFKYQRYEPFVVNLQAAVCEGMSVNLNVNATDPIAYLWSSNAGNNTTPFVTVTPTVPSSTYKVTVTNSLGCEAVAMASINVIAAPVVNLSGASEICIGGTTQLLPSSGGYWVSTNPNVAQVNSSGIVTGISGGTVDFYYTEQIDFCTSLNPIQITVLSDGIQGFNESELCIGDTTYLSPNTGGVWTAINTDAFSVNPSGMVIGLAAGSGMFHFAYDGNGCVATTYGDLTVNPKPQPNLAGGSEICIGTTTYITPSSGGTWTSINPSIASINEYGTITGIAIGSSTFTFESDVTGCVSDESAPVNVNAIPVPIIDGPKEICAGSTTNLLPNTGGVWQSTNPSVATVTSNGVVYGVSSGEARFIFVIDGGLCRSDTSEVITIIPRPTISLSGDNSICIGETTSFLPSTGGTWSSSDDNIAVINNSGIVTAVSAGVVNFVYENGTTTCSSDPSSSITVNGSPVLTLIGEDSICIGSVTNLSPTTGGLWTSSNNTIAIISSTGMVTGMGAGVATFTFLENQNNCLSSASIPITIFPRPIVQITGPTEICQGSTTTLSPTSGGYWTSNNTSVATVSATGVVTGVGQGIVRFTFVTDFGCVSIQTAPILVHGKPNPIFIGAPSICVGSTIGLMPNEGGTWSSSDTSVASITNSGVVTGINSGLATFVFNENNTGCNSFASADLTVNSIPILNVPPDSRLCVGTTLQIAPTSGGEWHSTNPTIATINNDGVITGIFPGSAEFYYQNVISGCISLNSSPVIVDPRPIIAVSGPSSICIGDTSFMMPDTGGTWESMNPSIASITINGVALGVSDGITEFMFTSNLGCPSNISSSLTVNLPPMVGLFGQQFICIGSTTSLFPSSGGTWTSSDTSVASVTNSGIVMGFTEGIVYLTYTDTMTGCSSSGDLQVNILPPPTIALDGDAEICIGYTSKVSASTTGYWTSSDLRIASVTNDGVITGIAPGEVEFTFIDGLTGCANDGGGIVINVGKCLNPDFNVTLLNTVVNGDLSTNDLTPHLGVYHPIAILKSKPAGSVYTMNVNSDGTYNFMANKAGKYIFDIQVCIPPIDFGCPMSTIEVTVIGDVYSQNIPINNLEFVTTFANDNINLAGDYVTFNAMANDACVSGLGCNLGASNTSIAIPTTNGFNTYVGSGVFSYTPGIGHLGKDVLTYKVCSDFDPNNCSISSTYITVASKSTKNSVVAPDDFNYTLSGTTVVGNVIENDMDPEGDLLTVQPMGSAASSISITGGSYYIEANGDYSFTPDQYFSGPTSFVYSICDDNVESVCMDATVHLIVIGDMAVSVKVYLEGALLNNGDQYSAEGKPLMRDDLRVSPYNGKNYIPLTDPYTTGTGLNAHGIKSHIGPGLLSENQTIQDSAAVFAVTGDNAIVDWIFLELRSKIANSICIGTRSALLQRDGDVVELDGVSPVRFNGLGVDSFYIVVSHRNHLGVMSELVSNSTVVDFTNTNTVTHNFGFYVLTGYDYSDLSANKKVKEGHSALWAGDFNSNGIVGFIGGDDDSNVIITDVLLFPNNVDLNANYDFAYGYFNGDYDLNSKVKYNNPSDDTNMLFTQVLLYKLNSSFASNFSSMIEQVPPRTN